MEGDGASFGAELRRLRLRAGLTQESLAKRAGISVNAVSALERGVRTRPYPHTRDALTKALGLTEDERLALRTVIAEPSARSALPALPSTTVGGTELIAAVADLLDRCRLVTLTGPGGVGKTRMAIEVAARTAADYRDGAVYVSLAPLTEPADVLPTLAENLGLRELGRRDLADVLTRYLRTRHLLVVMDNFEHLLPAAADLAVLLASAPELTVLVTSRALLRIASEHVYPVPPLEPSVAAELFFERAREAAGRANIAEPGVVDDICRKVDCLPLAIELAAAATQRLSCTELLAAFDSALVNLSAQPQSAPVRQRTLWDTVDWSYRLLDQDAQLLFAQLSVFRGGWDLEAASAVSRLTEHAAAKLHLQLLDNSLLTRELASGEPRFAMLETIRAYAAEQLNRVDPAAAPDKACERHAMYFAQLMAQAGNGLWTCDQIELLGLLDADYPNIRIAMRWLLRAGRIDQLAESCTQLWLFWVARGYLRDLQMWADSAIEGAREVDQDLAPLVNARLRYLAAWSRLPRGDFDAAALRFAETARLAERAGNDVLRCWGLAGLANAEASRGDVAATSSVLEQALRLSRRLDDVNERAGVVCGLARAAVIVGHMADAAAMLTEAHLDIEAESAAWPFAVALSLRSRVAWTLGQHDESRELLTHSIRLFGRLRDSWGMTHQLTDAAGAAAVDGDLDRAAILYGAIDAIVEQTGATVIPRRHALTSRYRSEVLRGLGADSYREMHERGQRLNWEAVVAVATGAARS